jgi:hypothetical protein
LRRAQRKNPVHRGAPASACYWRGIVLQMLTIGAEGIDSLLLPLMIGALLMALLRLAVAVCARATEVRDTRAIAHATQATNNVGEDAAPRSHG